MERPKPDMFEEAMKQEVSAEPGQEDTQPKKVEGDMFDVAAAEAAEPEIELGDEDLEEVTGDMFDLAGAQVVDQMEVKKPVRLEGQADQTEGDMFAEGGKADMFDKAMEKAELDSARMAIENVASEGEAEVPSLPESMPSDFEVPEAPKAEATPEADEVIEVDDDMIVEVEDIPEEVSEDMIVSEEEISSEENISEDKAA